MVAAIDLVLSSQTALQFVALTQAVRDVLKELGRDVEIVLDRLPDPQNDRVAVTIAPHDVYRHLDLHDEELLEASLARTILVCCERPSAPAWPQVLPYAAAAAMVLDVSEAGVTRLEEQRIPARRFRLGYHERFDRWRGAATARPVDIAFLGSASPRRMQTLAEAAPVLTEHDVDLRISDDLSAAAQRRVDAEAGDDRWDLLARSKIVLNLHRDDGLSFEWLRSVAAICNGCVFLTEESSGASPLESDVHFVSGSRERLAGLAQELLRDPERLARIQTDAYRVLREEMPLRESVERLAARADDLPRPDSGRAGAALRQRPAPQEAPAEQATHPGTDLLAAMLEETSTTLGRHGAVMKRLFFDLRQLRRQVAELGYSLNGGDAATARVTTTPGAATATPEVTVLVSLYNYEGYVRAAVESALASQGVEIELVVVDDASVDRSVSVVKAVMEENPQAAITLLEQPVNTGVQRARNRAVEHARGQFVFVLDADNLVYPRGIAKLRDALRADDRAAFAYGLIERFGVDGPIGLMNTQGWDLHLLADHHYIDMMALLRLDALREVGGYVTDPTLELGWEDYDLWLSFAGAGYHAAHVREIVGRYRVHGVSSLTFTTLDVEDLKAKLRQRHAGFFASLREQAR